LNGEEIERLLAALEAAALPPLPGAALRLLILTGARKGEILGLKWTDLDLAQSRAVLSDHKTISRGDRLLYLPPEGVAILDALPKHTSPYVFAGSGKHGTLGSTLDHAWRRVRELAGLPGVRIHDLRHTFASLAIAGGLTLEQAGQLLGHSSPATTKRYSHLVDEAARANVAKVAGALARRRG
jgi:integrase